MQRPEGQDLTRHLQVYELLRVEKRHPERPRKESAEHIANAYGGSRKLSIFILQSERLGETKIFSREGALIAVRIYRTHSTKGQWFASHRERSCQFH